MRMLVTARSLMLSASLLVPACAAPLEDSPAEQQAVLTPSSGDRADGDIPRQRFTLTAAAPRLQLTVPCDEWFSCDVTLYVSVVNLGQLDPGAPGEDDIGGLRYRGLVAANVLSSEISDVGTVYAVRDASGLHQCIEQDGSVCRRRTDLTEPQVFFDLHSSDADQVFTFNLGRHEDVPDDVPVIVEVSAEWY